MRHGLRLCPARFLNLSNNPLMGVQPGLFDPLTQLRILDLSSTRLPSLPPHAFAATTRLGVCVHSPNHTPCLFAMASVCVKGTGASHFSLIHRSHSVSFTRAQGIPKYKIGFGRGK